MARVKQPRRKGHLLRPNQGGSADSKKQPRRSGHLLRPNQVGNADSTSPDPKGNKPSPLDQDRAPCSRGWSQEDAIRILEVAAEYVAEHGKPPARSELEDLFKDRGLERADATVSQLYEKLRSLRERYHRERNYGGPGGGDATGALMYELSAKIWGGPMKQVSERRALMRCLFPHLSDTVDEIATESGHGMLPRVFKRTYELVDDDEAAKLEANIKNQKIKVATLTMTRDALANEVFAELLEAQPMLHNPKKQVSERRAFEEMSCLFPHLSRAVEGIVTESRPGMLPAVFKRAYELLVDDEAAQLEAKIKEQQIKAARLTMCRDTLVNDVFTELLHLMD